MGEARKEPDEQVFRLGSKPLPIELACGMSLTIRRHGDRKRLRIGITAARPVKAKRKKG